MANSKYEYTRAFEREEILLPNTFIVVRVDGKGFHKLSNFYNFTKPNDARALDLMNAAAAKVMSIVYDIFFAYGVSDEYSFVFERDSKLFERRRDKLVSTIVSTFTAAYIQLWSQHFPDQPLDDMHLPTFDGRAVMYPTTQNLKDYLSWRQVDCHINNLYNTTFWAMVLQGGMGQREAEQGLKGSLAADKNEMLWSRFGINYNNEDEMFRKGSVIFREYEVKLNGAGVEPGQPNGPVSEPSKTQQERARKAKMKAEIVVRHVDIIKEEFWDQRPWLLGGKGTRGGI